jgi:polysaccharide export outer membrane protein
MRKTYINKNLRRVLNHSLVFKFALIFNILCVQVVFAGNAFVEGYKIGPEDLLEISVWKEQDLQKEVLVRPDGRISFPLVGEVIVSGKTPAEVQDEIAARLKKYIPDPVVTILIKKIASYKIYVIGQVNKSGQFVVGQYLDVTQALALAGGLTPFASEDKIKILRRKNGKEVVIPFEYSAIKKGENLEQNVILQSADVVIVP